MKTILHKKQADGTFVDETVDIDCHFVKRVRHRTVVADPQGNWRASGIDKVPVVFAVITADYPKNPYGNAVSEADWKARCDEAYPNLVTVKTRKFAYEKSFENLKNISSVAALSSGIHEVED